MSKNLCTFLVKICIDNCMGIGYSLVLISNYCDILLTCFNLFKLANPEGIRSAVFNQHVKRPGSVPDLNIRVLKNFQSSPYILQD